MASSPSPWSSSGKGSGRVFLKVNSTTEDEMSCISLLIWTRESKGAVSKPRIWLGMSMGLDGDCGQSSMVSSSLASQSESSSRANRLAKSNSNESHESEEVREGMFVGWQDKL